MRTWLPVARPTAAALAAGGLAWTAWLGTHEAEYDELAASVTAWPWRETAAVLTLLALAAVHFLSAALALRSVSDERLAVIPTVWAQLAAGAADRIVPNGVGGLALNLRYLCRAGMPAGAATSALALLAVIGIATDAGYGALVTVTGGRLGLPGAGQELHVLTQAGLHASSTHHWFLLGSLLVGAAVLLLRRRRQPRERVQRETVHALRHLRELARRPIHLSAAGVASAATTVVMSAGFTIAAHTWGDAATPLNSGALIAVYLLAVAVSGAAPVPPFLGGTELALVAALTVSGYTTPSAVLVVALFRGIMYWLPLPLGFWGARHLRRAGML